MASPEHDEQRVRVAELILGLRRAGITDQRVVAAMEATPREMFVPADQQDVSYAADRALPIDCGQTISAPVIVGMMTVALDVGPRDRVLEVGTGSGYQAAVLARLVRRVYTMDRYRTLVRAAESRFRALGLSNITAQVSDGILGWPEQAPFDRIIVTAAAEEIPKALEKQVKVGGIIVIPIGPQDGVQKLMRLERFKDGFDEKMLADVRFVPLVPGKAERL
jgi:protein-L-isoaspartate(D-aspartate) O-methyltransferase